MSSSCWCECFFTHLPHLGLRNRTTNSLPKNGKKKINYTVARIRKGNKPRIGNAILIRERETFSHLICRRDEYVFKFDSHKTHHNQWLLLTLRNSPILVRCLSFSSCTKYGNVFFSLLTSDVMKELNLIFGNVVLWMWVCLRANFKLR